MPAVAGMPGWGNTGVQRAVAEALASAIQSLLRLLDVVGEELRVQAVDRVAGDVGRRDHDLRVEVEPVAGGVLGDELVGLGELCGLLVIARGGFRVGDQLDHFGVVVAPVEVGVAVEDDVAVVDVLLQRRLEIVLPGRSWCTTRWR